MNDVQKFYRLSGMPYALQIWWYECCAAVDESLAVHVHNLILRMVNWKLVEPKPRYEDLMDDMFSKLVYRNLIPSSQELNHLKLPNPLMFGPTDHDANVAQTVSVQQQSERTAPTEFGDEFNDFSTPLNTNFLKRTRLDAGPSSHSPAKKQKLVEESEKFSFDKVAHNVEMRDSDKASFAREKKLLLSKSDLDDIKSYVAQYPLHGSEKGIPDREGDPPQSFNEHKMNAKSDNVVDDAGQSSKVGGNEGGAEECLKDSEETFHNTDKDLSKAITLYVLPSPAAYPVGITNIAAVAIDTCDQQSNTDSQCYIRDNAIASISQVPVCKTNMTYSRKKPSKRNRKPSKLYQSPFVSVFDSGSKDKKSSCRAKS
ncbi:hypothetical protein CQW23_27712 [Capsicum baccatum]|uniref:Uncharacterized protein n=1 Tax=Capsicum baccatum TaxID=33114 RepID=A0A2G2VEG4_CAPBA|nr:hypothetical protein CQW23_27712 [Capsicum baccatum]